jgi:hypothetical protein
MKKIANRRSAFCLIRRNCLSSQWLGEEYAWWDTAIAPNDIEADRVAAGIAYLESRGLLIRHKRRSNLIRVIERRTLDQTSEIQ